MLSVVLLSVMIVNVALRSVIMLSVKILIAIMANVVAPKENFGLQKLVSQNNIESAEMSKFCLLRSVYASDFTVKEIAHKSKDFR